MHCRVEFRALTLLDRYSSLCQFDVVFCRSVLLSCCAEVDLSILRRIHGTLA
ncbi:CheR family methyltransferase, partial [Pseudomonas aeruginosa]